MTIRKRNDADGHKRGEGHYSSKHPSLDRRDYFLNKVSSVPAGHVSHNDSRRSAEGAINGGSGETGFSTKLPKR